jgi:hypothetical protein
MRYKVAGGEVGRGNFELWELMKPTEQMNNSSV